jgi:plastocyanin
VVSVVAETSKVPFYIAGAVLVAWAVVLSFIGVRNARFPGSRRNARLVMLVSATLVAATVTSAVLTGSTPHEAAATGPAPTTATLAAQSGGALAYDTKELTLHAGRATLNFKNASPIPHNVTIAAGSRNITATRTIKDSTTSLQVKLDPGSYVFFCSVDAHRQAGMQGTLTVR